MISRVSLIFILGTALSAFVLCGFCVGNEPITSLGPIIPNLKPPGAEVCHSISDYKDNVFCKLNFTFVFIGHCFGYIDKNVSQELGLRLDHEFEGYVATRCPFYAGLSTKKMFATIPELQPKLINDAFCKNISDSNRQGFLCKECDSGSGISVLSPNFKCQNCSKYKSKLTNFLKLFGITILPLTLLFLIITVFHISLTSAPTNAYIFFSHIMTLKVFILIVETAWANSHSTSAKSNARMLSNILLFPLYIWNLDFAYFVRTEVACIGKGLRIMHIIFMYYLYAAYPMLLLLVTFVLVKLHDRNFKPVVFLWKPFYCVCVRVRRNWNIRTSLIDAFASCILLSYSKLIDVSLALINPNPVYDRNGTTIYITLHYDINTRFLSNAHVPFFIIAIIVFSTFGLLPPLLLTLYPFRWFQKVLNKIHLNKVQSLFIFLDAFQGCYKNGTGGSPERRYFAGFYFIFRIIILFLASFGYTTIPQTVTVLTAVCAAFLCIIAVFQPYKNNFYNFLDAAVFLILTITCSNLLYVLSVSQRTGQLPDGIWPITYTLLMLPSTYMAIYMFYWILTRFRARCCGMRGLSRRLYTVNDYAYDRMTEESRTSNESSLASIEYLSDSFPDRLNNPYRYETSSQGIFKDHNGPDFGNSRIKRAGAELAHYGAMTF